MEGIPVIGAAGEEHAREGSKRTSQWMTSRYSRITECLYLERDWDDPSEVLILFAPLSRFLKGSLW